MSTYYISVSVVVVLFFKAVFRAERIDSWIRTVFRPDNYDLCAVDRMLKAHCLVFFIPTPTGSVGSAALSTRNRHSTITPNHTYISNAS